MKKNCKKQYLFISLICIFALSVGCGFQNTAYKGMSEGIKSFADKAVLGAQSIVGEYSTVSVNETGIFFFDKQERLSYYDYVSGEKYIMCSNPKCSHNTEECNAYMGEKDCYGGYALYDENIYIWYQPKDSAYMELAQMDSVGQEKKIIAEIYAGGGLDEWHINYLNDVYYFQGYAFVEVYWIKSDVTSTGMEIVQDARQLLAVDLDNGRIVELTDMMQYEKDVLNLSYVMFDDQKAVFVQDYFKEPMLSEDDYYLKHPEGDYSQYYDAFWEETPQGVEYRMFRLDTQEITPLWSEDCEYYKDQDGGQSYYKWPFQFCGSVDGRWLTMAYDNEKTEYAWFDPQTGQFDLFWNPDRSVEDALGRVYGDWYFNLVYDDKETVFSLDLNTGKRRELFTTENGWFSQSINDYLILEETSQYLVAKENGGTVYFVVKKSDFEKSGMDEAKKIYL